MLVNRSFSDKLQLCIGGVKGLALVVESTAPKKVLSKKEKKRANWRVGSLIFHDSHTDMKSQVNTSVFNKILYGCVPFNVEEPVQWANVHTSSIITLFDLNGTEPQLVSLLTTPEFTPFFYKMTAVRNPFNHIVLQTRYISCRISRFFKKHGYYTPQV